VNLEEPGSDLDVSASASEDQSAASDGKEEHGNTGSEESDTEASDEEFEKKPARCLSGALICIMPSSVFIIL
jgi:hypothetical protein